MAAVACFSPASAEAPAPVEWSPGRLPWDEDDDLRDRLVTKDGKEIRGRLVERFGVDELVVLVGRKEVLVDRLEVVELDTVRDRIGTFLGERKAGLDAAGEWKLAERALELELPGFAVLQAYRVLLIDEDHEGAHELLEHKGRPGRWKWKAGKKFLTREKWEDHVSDWGHPLELWTEHYHVRTDAGLGRAIDLCYELEFFYHAWVTEFGRELQPREVLEPMGVQVWREREKMPALSTRRDPYYEPGALFASASTSPNSCYSYYEEEGVRPVRIFDLATQQMLYTSLLNERTRGSSSGQTYLREAAALEVGLGHWFGSQFTGPAGFPERVAFTLSPQDASFALQNMRRGPLDNVKKELPNLIGMGYQRFHEISGECDVYWSKARGFVAWMMDSGSWVRKDGSPLGSTRASLMEFLRLAFTTPQGFSSRTFDKTLDGARIEDQREAWRDWLKSKLR